MILMAADYVGNEVTKYLCQNHKQIDVFVYDEDDRGGYNQGMIDIVKRYYPQAEIYVNKKFLQDDVLAHIKQMNITLGCLAWWPNIIDEKIINLTTGGFINTHPSYLPYNRGKHPYFWSIIDGTKFGVTLHYVDVGIDSGAIIAQKEIPVSWTDTGESLYQKSREEILKLFYEYFDIIEAGKVKTIGQENTSGSFHYGKELEPFCKLSLDRQYSARDLLNILRGRMFNGKGAATFSDNDKTYQVSIHIEEVSKKG